jgi:hypothetical protein
MIQKINDKEIDGDENINIVTASWQ